MIKSGNPSSRVTTTFEIQRALRLRHSDADATRAGVRGVLLPLTGAVGTAAIVRCMMRNILLRTVSCFPAEHSHGERAHSSKCVIYQTFEPIIASHLLLLGINRKYSFRPIMCSICSDNRLLHHTIPKTRDTLTICGTTSILYLFIFRTSLPCLAVVFGT